MSTPTPLDVIVANNIRWSAGSPDERSQMVADHVAAQVMDLQRAYIELGDKLRECERTKAPLLTGELTRAGTFMVGLDQVTGIVIDLPIEELRAVKHLPLYRRVSVTLTEPQG